MKREMVFVCVCNVFKCGIVPSECYNIDPLILTFVCVTHTESVGPQYFLLSHWVPS